MKIRSVILIIVYLSTLLMAGCAAPASQPTQAQALPTQVAQSAPTQPPASPASPTPNPNTEIVLNMAERLNAGDIDGSLAYFAEDALIYFIGMPPTGMEFYGGREALRTTWEYCVSDHFEMKVEITGVEGDLVYTKSKTWMDFTRQLGVAPNEFIDIFQVKDGKITTYGSTMTKEALSRFKPAFYEVMPPEPTPVPVSASPSSEMAVTIAEGTCTTDSPAALQAGEVTLKLNVEDQDKSLYALTLFTLDPGKDMLDLMASTVGSPPGWADFLLYEQFGPGVSKTYTFTLETGPVYLICWSQPPVLPIGNAGPFEVSPMADIAPPPERGADDIMVSFADKKCTYEGPPVLPSGSINVIMNMQEQDAYKAANALMFFTLEQGYDLQDLIDKIWMPSPPDWAHMIFMHEAYPSEVTTNELAFEAGPLYYVCLSGETEDSAQLVGKGGPLEVSSK